MADSLSEALEQLLNRSNTEGPSDTVLVINGNLRTITIPKDFFFGVYNDANVLSVPFTMPRYYADNDLSDFSIRINFVSATGVGSIYAIENPTVGTDSIEFEWLTSRAVFLGAGDVTFNVCLRKLDANDNVVKEYNTTLARGSVLAGLEVDNPEDPEVYSIYTKMEELRAATEALLTEATAMMTQMYGAPLKASSFLDMTDADRIYVYTGNETGYTAGNWYYFSGSSWTSGGVYNSTAVNTDATLTVTGSPADAKATGDRFASDESGLASLENRVDDIEDSLNNISIDPDDLGLEQDPDTYYVYPTYKGIRSENGIPLASSGGGGGGGGDIVSAIFTAENTTGWTSKTIANGGSCVATFSWSSIEDGNATGDGTVRITVNEIVRATMQVSQGNISVDLTQYLTLGQNKVKVRISDVYDQGKTIAFNVTVISLSLSSSFDDSMTYSGAITFPFTPVGAVDKTVYFIVDGSQNGTITTSVSGRQLSYAIPALSHGGHSIRVYFESTVNGETVRSNELYYEFKVVVSGATTTIITSSFNDTTRSQYSSIVIPYYVYDPENLTAQVVIADNGTTLSTQTVDRTAQSFTYRANTYGTRAITITSGSVTKTITLTITELDIDVEAETEDLSLYLSSQGRSNNEEHPDTWSYGNVECTFTDFNWASDGWQLDDDGITVMRVSGDARLTIPYELFGSDFRATGKTIEIEFATRHVLDYDTTVLSCVSGGRGITVTAQNTLLKSEQSEISTQYKEDEHVRISFVVEKRTEHRLLFIYINGIASGVVQYPNDDDFSQVTPVGITVGSNDCTIDLYCIRIYDNDLTRNQIVDNWIADTQDGTTLLDRYTRNNIYDAYGNVVISALPSDLPYLIIECPELPQYKGDKKTCSGSYTDPLHQSKSFTFTNAQFDVQGTSSQYYPRKNYKAKFKNGFVINGETVSKYAMNADAIPTNTFCFKADVASSEGANNVELARLYNDVCPYKTPGQVSNAKVRQGIDGFPIVIFWNDTANNETIFLGKYNFNNDKGTSEVFGFVDPDESWEIRNNTSNRVIWKSADYTGDGWLNDFEARYPDTDPPYEDPAQLAEFAAWLVSTDTTAATNEALDESVTYDEVTYTTDSAAYRLAKFKAEASNYMELQSALFYYLFTELFLMVDSRAKNAFPSFMGSEVVGS